MTTDTMMILDSSISKAWGKVFLGAMSPGGILGPMCVSIAGFGENGPEESPEVRHALDTILRSGDNTFPSKITAATIFPYAYWATKRPSRDELFAWYLDEFLPRYVARTPRKKKETYFERLIAYRGHETAGPLNVVPKLINQLDHILTVWNLYKTKGKSPARSKLQASCFDPSRDHDSTPYTEFPCLQQIGFSYDDSGGLTVTGYYTVQYIMDRAYGNYIGLYHLGLFMAHEMGLKLIRVNCFTANPRLGDYNKSDLRGLERIVKQN